LSNWSLRSRTQSGNFHLPALSNRKAYVCSTNPQHTRAPTSTVSRRRSLTYRSSHTSIHTFEAGNIYANRIIEIKGSPQHLLSL
jgi:hypothetical protein